MSVPLTAALTAAIALPTAEPRTLVDLDTQDGLYRFATETLSWSGLTYTARVTDVGAINLSLGAIDQRVVSAKTVSVTFANADGWFSRKRPEFFRGRPLTLREVLLDVNSDALATYAFRVTGGRMVDSTRYQLDAEDALSAAGRALVPSNQCIITRDNFPLITDNAAGLGATYPLLFGRAYTPLYLVDDTVANAKFLACVGSAVAPTSTCGVVQVYPTDEGPFSFVSTLDLRYETIANVPLTFVYLNTDSYTIYFNGQPLPHFAELQVDSDTAFPADVLVSLLTNPFYGAGLGATDLNSASVAQANQFTQAESAGFATRFACTLTAQRPMEDWLNDWAHESLINVVAREVIYLVPEAASRTGQASFTPANILQGTLRSQDLAVGASPTERTVYYRDRTRDIGSASQQTYAATSGSATADTAAYIGTPADAFRVAQFWSRYAAGGLRQYQFDSTLRVANLDPGDLVTLTHTQVGASALTCEVTGFTRAGRTASVTLREIATGTFSLAGSIPANPVFARYYERVQYSFGSYMLVPGAQVTITASHHLQQTPNFQTPIWYSAALGQYFATSYVSANNSQIAISHTNITASFNLRLDTSLASWDLRV